MHGYEFKIVVQTAMGLSAAQKGELLDGVLKRFAAHCTPQEWGVEVLSVSVPTTYRCHCGQPVDMTNSDCVDFGLCDEHSDDA